MSTLRAELCHRAGQYAQAHGLPHCLSYGHPSTVCFESYNDDSLHGNFLPATYKAIQKNPDWRRRLQKVHAQGRKSLPRLEFGVRRELDTCTSSDALLMNIFCYPGVSENSEVCSMLDVRPSTVPEFGFRARVPFSSGKLDRTEVDMRLDNLLVEAKLTESGFQKAPKPIVGGYRDFGEVFEAERLPQSEKGYQSYQLIRNVLAAQAAGCAFCVFVDARRPDLIEAWYAVMKCVCPTDLRVRCKVLTWQELARVLPRRLRMFLGQKYGIHG